MVDIIFKLDAQTAKAVNGFLKVVDSQKKMNRGFKAAVKTGKRMDKTLTSIKRTALNLAGGFIGAQGIRMAVGKVVEGFKAAIQATIQFEDEMTGLLSLGENVNNIDAVKKSVLDMSAGFGIAKREIADAMFNLESGSAGLGKAIQDDILKRTVQLVKVTGTDMPTAMNSLLKSYRIFGDETNTVERIQSKLFKTAELGFLTFTDMAVLMPDLEAAAKTFGFSMDEVGGAVITATQKMGRTQVTLTALRNVFLSMTAAQKQGVDMTGNFIENVQKLSEMDPDILLKLFGKRTVTAIGVLVDDTAALEKNIKAVASVEGEIVSEKLMARLSDNARKFAEISKTLREATENAKVVSFSPGASRLQTGFELAKLGAVKALPAFLHDFAGPLAALEVLTGRSNLQKQGRAEHIKIRQRNKQFEQLQKELTVIPTEGILEKWVLDVFEDPRERERKRSLGRNDAGGVAFWQASIDRVNGKPTADSLSAVNEKGK